MKGQALGLPARCPEGAVEARRSRVPRSGIAPATPKVPLTCEGRPRRLRGTPQTPTGPHKNRKHPRHHLTTHRSVKAPPTAARAWLSSSPNSPARRPIPHAARGLKAVLARAGPTGVVVGKNHSRHRRGGSWVPHESRCAAKAGPSTSTGSSTSRHRCQGRCAPHAVACGQPGHRRRDEIVGRDEGTTKGCACWQWPEGTDRDISGSDVSRHER